MAHPSSATNLWNQGTTPQMTASQMWTNYQHYPGYGYQYPVPSPGYAPYAASAMQNGGLYVPAQHAGYAPYVTSNSASFVGTSSVDPTARYANQASASHTAGYRPDYGMEGPPTKKRLTSENQISASSPAYPSPATAPSSSTYASHTSSSQSSPPSAATSPQDWPPSLLKFVTRCYEATPAANTPALEKKLTEMIKLAEQSKTLWTRDWDAMPPPALPTASSSTKASHSHPSNVQFNLSTSSSPKTTAKSKLATNAQSSSRSASVTSKLTSKAPTKGSKKGSIAGTDWEEEEKREQRASRFSAPVPSGAGTTKRSYGYGDDDYELEEGAIVGTSTSLEKAYLRLTERPKPSDVRPVAVLKKSLALMQQKKKEGASWTGYLGEQMKSIRLDLVIQSVADEFALQVYETNARWCLENDDVAEFKRCLLRIDEFYNHFDLQSDNINEFSCYSLLYHLLSEDFPSLNAELATLGPDRKKHPAILHAIRIAESYLTNNWHQFYLLSKTSYFLESHILNIVSERVLIHALESIFISYRPSVPIEWLQKQTGFSTKKDAISWLNEHDCVFTDSKRTAVDAKDSLKGLMEWQSKNKPGK